MNFPGLDPLWTYGHQAKHTLGLMRTWSLLQARKAVEEDKAKILVVATTALGDSLLTTPLFETLSERLGRDRVSLLVKAPYTGLYENDPRLSKVLSVRGKFRFLDLQQKLADDPHRVALIANMTEPDLVPFLWRCGVRGFLRYRTRWTRFPRWMANHVMLRQPGQPDYATGHAIENNLAMAKALGIEATTHRLSLPQFKNKTGHRDNLLLIHPGASRESKRWPVENWARLGDFMTDKFGCRIALTGDRNEALLAMQIAAAMKAKPEMLAGKLSLAELAQRQSQAMAFFSGDTGPYHLAVSVDCSTVTLFAPTDRGSSTEACGPHQAHASYHRAIQTRKLGDSIHTIGFEQMTAVAIATWEAAQARQVKVAAA